MSGHSKWATIKRQKGAKDARRGEIFTKLASAITVAAKKGGGDPVANFTLRLATDKARAANMPKENIERAIKRGTGELAGNQVEELLLEGFGPGGAAIIIEVLTDNKNRTLPEIRNLLIKFGGQLASQGAVSYQFKQQGVIRIKEDQEGKEDLETKIIESGAQDYNFEDGQLLVITDLPDLQNVREFFDSQNITVESAAIEFVPTSLIELAAADQEKLIKLLENLNECDDVSNIYTNGLK